MNPAPAGAGTPPPQPSQDQLRRIVEEHWWYHRMNLGLGVRTPGQHGDNLLPIAALLAHVPLDGTKCVDIGTMDGKMSFLMERRGASDVLAVDGVAKGTVPALAAAFGSAVRYRSGYVVERLPVLAEEEGLFDVVLCSGVAYHVYSPFDLVANVRGLLRNGGVAVFETAAIHDDTNRHMSLNHGDHYREYTTLWIPTTACFRYMMEFMAFEVLGEAELRTGDYHVVRAAWVARAARPSLLARKTADPWLSALLGRQAPGWSHEYLKPQFDHDRFESAPESCVPRFEVPPRQEFRLEVPSGYEAPAALLEDATPAWRLAR